MSSTSPFVATSFEITHLIALADEDSSLVGQLVDRFRSCLAGVNHRPVAYGNPRRFWESVDSATSGCLVVVVGQEASEAVAFMEELSVRGLHLPVIFLYRTADAATCRACFKLGAIDFLHEDQAPEELTELIISVQRQRRVARATHQKRADVERRLADLTARELEVARLLADGKALKEVGVELAISPQTASKHRMNVFHKLHVGNEVELHKALRVCDAVPSSLA